MWIKRKDYDKMVVRIEFLENQLCPNGVHDFKEIDSYLTGGTGNGDEQRITICKCTKCGKIKEIQLKIKAVTYVAAFIFASILFDFQFHMVSDEFSKL